QETLGRPAVIGNDCDVAALAEARLGGVRGAHPVFYVTVGTAIGGGRMVGGRRHGQGRPAAAEIGHWRPRLNADQADVTVEALGWAIGQVITRVAPEVVVVGGGVSLIGEHFFFMPLRAEVARYVFPPLVRSYKIVSADLGELSVVHGAIALAAGNQ